MKRNRIDYTALAIPKRPPVRRPKLRAWIATQPCLVQRVTGEPCTMKTHAAHVPTGTGGMGMKGDDLFVPLCFHHHIDTQHAAGVFTFEQRYSVNLREEGERYLAWYMEEAA